MEENKNRSSLKTALEYSMNNQRANKTNDKREVFTKKKSAIICPNCGKTLSCGCQKKTAANGKACCIYCVKKENLNIISNSASKPRKMIP